MTTGQIVQAVAGREKGKFFIVLAKEHPYVFLCDGRCRPMAAPKKKSLLHVKATPKMLQPNEFKTDKSIRKALRLFMEQF